jgi:PAS domain S-box-containing protein
MPFFGKVYGAGISWNGKLNGSAIFVLPPGVELENRELITFFIRQVAGFLSRVEAEAALKESEEKFSAAFHSSAVLMAISTKHDGKFIDVNETFLEVLGFSREEVIGKRISELDLFVNPSDRLLALSMLEEKGEVRNLEVPVNTKNGAVQYGLFSALDIMIGEVPCLLTTMVDITEQKILEKEMEFHEQEVMRFSRSLDMAIRKLNLLSSITRHDINNQLTVLMGYLDMLAMNQPDTLRDEHLRRAAAAAQRISVMIQFTKTYESIGVKAPVWQDIQSVADTAAKEVQLGRVILKNDLPASAAIFADPLIAKVFYNLMDNAVRYGGTITTVRFSVEEGGGDPVIVCEDDGNGIPAEEKEKIFERGYGKNTGLGLFLAREILSITGITIRETGKPGKGARFEITVPKDVFRVVGSP